MKFIGTLCFLLANCSPQPETPTANFPACSSGVSAKKSSHSVSIEILGPDEYSINHKLVPKKLLTENLLNTVNQHQFQFYIRATKKTQANDFIELAALINDTIQGHTHLYVECQLRGLQDGNQTTHFKWPITQSLPESHATYDPSFLKIHQDDRLWNGVLLSNKDHHARIDDSLEICRLIDSTFRIIFDVDNQTTLQQLIDTFDGHNDLGNLLLITTPPALN